MFDHFTMLVVFAVMGSLLHNMTLRTDGKVEYLKDFVTLFVVGLLALYILK